MAGNSSNLLNTPLDAALDSQNNLYVADRLNHRIQMYLTGAINGTTVAGNASGLSGSGLNDLKRPSQVVIASYGNFFVTDTYNQRIMFWSNNPLSGTVVAGVTSR